MVISPRDFAFAQPEIVERTRHGNSFLAFSSPMVPDWLRCPKDLPSGSEPVIGVAVGVSDASTRQLHAGVVHADEGRPAHVLHLAWHATARNEVLPLGTMPLWWVPLPIERDKAEAIAALCRRIAKRIAQDRFSVPYGLVYEGGRIRDDGITEFAGREIGFTCATFVLAVLESAGITLLALDTWHARGSDIQWHAHIVQRLRETQAKFDIPDKHILGVQGEMGCARYRPEEVASACSCSPIPVSLAIVASEARVLRLTLLPGSPEPD